MKKYLLFLTSVVFACSMQTANAQIVSAADDDMETWNTDPLVFTAKDPNSGVLGNSEWQCLNIFNNGLLGGSPVSCFEENTIVHSGSHSCKLQSVVFTPTSYNYVKSLFPHDTLGVVFTGTITNTPSIIPGVPFTSRTSAVNFYYQYTPQMNNGKPDTAYCAVVLSQNHVTIGSGIVEMNAAATWTSGTCNVTYTQAGNPDTIIVIFSSSSQFAPAPNSLLYIDGITAAAPLGVNEMSAANSVLVYPNPASSVVNFKVNRENAHSIQVFDITGKQLSNQTLKDNTLSLNTDSYPTGLYIYKLSDKNGAVIKAGKFSIER